MTPRRRARRSRAQQEDVQTRVGELGDLETLGGRLPSGLTDPEAHPALPRDRPRRDELDAGEAPIGVMKGLEMCRTAS